MFGCFLTKHGFLLPMTKRRGFLIPSHMTREETSLLLSAILVWTSGWARGYPLHWLNHSRIWGPAHYQIHTLSCHLFLSPNRLKYPSRSCRVLIDRCRQSICNLALSHSSATQTYGASGS